MVRCLGPCRLIWGIPANLPSIFRRRGGHALNAAALAHLDTERAHTLSLYAGRANGDADCGTEPQPNADGYAHSHAYSETHSHTEPHSHADGDTYPDAYTYVYAHPDCHTYTNATSFRECRSRRCRVPGWVS